jgi:hypothetical protein
LRGDGVATAFCVVLRETHRNARQDTPQTPDGAATERETGCSSGVEGAVARGGARGAVSFLRIAARASRQRRAVRPASVAG